MRRRNRTKRNFHLSNTLYWYISGLCNLHCSFCALAKRSKYVEQEVLWTLNNISRLQDQFRELPGTWELFIGGGEPFAFPSFLKIVQRAVTAGLHISVVTNFTSPLETLERFCSIVDKRICLLVASYKPGIHVFEEFLNKAIRVNKLVKNGGGHFSVGTVAQKRDINHSYEKGKILLKNGIDFALQVEKINGHYRACSQSEKEKILYFGRNFGLDGNNIFTKHTCFAGINYFVLVPGGSIYRCHSAINNPGKAGSCLGNILDGTFSLLERPLKCKYEFCNCVNAYNKGIIIPESASAAKLEDSNSSQFRGLNNDEG